MHILSLSLESLLLSESRKLFILRDARPISHLLFSPHLTTFVVVVVTVLACKSVEMVGKCTQAYLNPQK